MNSARNEDVLIGHSKEDGTIQALETHLLNVAETAETFCKQFGSGPWGYAAGLLHDDGKAIDAFQLRIRALMQGRSAKRVDHSTPGAKFAENNVELSNGFGKLLAYLIAGHHSGLPNGNEGGDVSSLMRRLEGSVLGPGIMADKLPKLNLPLFMSDSTIDKRKLGFKLSFFLRMVYSALVDADFLDTEAFMDYQRHENRSGYPSLSELFPLLESYLLNLEYNSPNTPINQQRKKILTEAKEAAEKEAGLFSLTVPTGGGKTLSSLAFAFLHALQHGMQRIIYVIPYTSIIEQTAAEFKKIFGDEVVIEHHSNYLEEGEENETSLKRKLATENWDAPIIVTTNIQFFESFFSNKSSKTRRIHSVARSVVILDEAHILPVPFLKPTIEVIRELAITYDSSLVLCTATQPALLENDDFEGGLSGVREIMKNPPSLEAAFERVHSKNLGNKSISEIAEIMASEEQVLCIVNTRSQARAVMEAIRVISDSTYHLSALMCPSHRREVLSIMKSRIAEGLPCKLVSTQLVEAGVDIDFPVVLRAIAGMDSIVQAAGRCNREGRLQQHGRLYVYYPEEGLPRGYFRQNAQITELVMQDKGDDYLSRENISEYFKELYWIKDKAGGLDKENILNLLERDVRSLDFSFKKVAKLYRLIPDDQISVIVPYDETAKKLCDELRFNTRPGFLLRKLQRYTVSLYPRQLRELVSAGFIEKVQDEFYLMTDFGMNEIYDKEIGINPSIPEFFESGFLSV